MHGPSTLDADPTDQVVDVLQHLIRAACVNDGRAESGHEHRAVDVLRGVLDGPGIDLETFEPAPGRTSLVARIEGTDPTAPTLLLMGHTDVVPVTSDGWRHDPFGGELVDGEVWGRGAVDMLNLTSSMAVVTRRLADRGFRPRGTLVYLAVADEEAGSAHGAEWLVRHAPDAVRADYVITESGGIVSHRPSGPKVTVHVGEKGINWVRLRIGGTPGHGSRPLRTDNALVKAAEVVHRLQAFRPRTEIGEIWRRWVEGMDFPAEHAAVLVDPGRLWDFVQSTPNVALARQAHACTHTTFSPNVIHGGVKTNVIPDEVILEVDIRTLPGQNAADVDALLADALGPLAADVTVEAIQTNPATASAIETPLWDSIGRVVDRLVPGAMLVPGLIVGGTDARFFREFGAVSYGFGLFSDRLNADRYAAMFHGHDERIDVDSLRLTTQLWDLLAHDLLTP